MACEPNHLKTVMLQWVLAVPVMVTLALLQPAFGSQHEGGEKDCFDALKSVPIGRCTLDIGGSLRLRYEYKENYNRKQYGTEKNDGYLLERFRMDAALSYSDRAKVFIQFQDAHVFDYGLRDSEFTSNPNEDEAELRQGFLEVRLLERIPVTLTAGRQVIAYGDCRIFGPGDWGNSGRVLWDAVKISWRIPDFFVDAFYGRTVIHDDHSFNLGHDHDKQAFGLYGSWEAAADNRIDFFYTAELDEEGDTIGEDNQTDDMRIHTVGIRAAGTIRYFDYDITVARQFGKWGSDDVSAWALHAGTGYTFHGMSYEPRIGIDYAFASGDRDPDDGRHETFEPAFGSRDKYFGWMNLFSWRNINNVQASLRLKPHVRCTVDIDYHFFWLAEKKDAWYSTGPDFRRDRDGKSGSDLGRELDVTIWALVSRHLHLRAGYAHFFPGRYVEKTGTHHSSDWLHVQLLYEF